MARHHQVAFLLLATGTAVQAQQTITSIADGLITNPLVWDCFCVPLPGDTVIIQHDMVLNTDYGYSSGLVRIDPTGRLVEDLPRSVGINGSGRLEVFGHLELANLYNGPGTEVTNGGTLVCDVGWLIEGDATCNGSVYGLDSLLVNGQLQINDTLQANKVYVNTTGSMDGVSPVLLFDDFLVLGVAEYFGGELVVDDDMLNMGDLELNNMTATIGDDFGNANEMAQSGTLVIDDDFYNADTTGMLNPDAVVNGAIQCRDWYNAGNLSGFGNFCVQDTTANSGSVNGTLDLCDLTPATSVPPLIDYNTGTVALAVTFCDAGPCTVGMVEPGHTAQVAIVVTDDLLFIPSGPAEPLDAFLLDPAGRRLAAKPRQVDGGIVFSLEGSNAGTYLVQLRWRNGHTRTQRFVLVR